MNKMEFCTGSVLKVCAFIQLGRASIGTHTGAEACEKQPL